ncbi:unnamed protein product, partial [Amoebophrya sp. A120]|eukprot:GSA120T00014609001.1
MLRKFVMQFIRVRYFCAAYWGGEAEICAAERRGIV